MFRGFRVYCFVRCRSSLTTRFRFGDERRVPTLRFRYDALTYKFAKSTVSGRLLANVDGETATPAVVGLHAWAVGVA